MSIIPIMFQIEISEFPLENFREKFRIFKNRTPRKEVEFLKRTILEEIEKLENFETFKN